LKAVQTASNNYLKKEFLFPLSLIIIIRKFLEIPAIKEELNKKCHFRNIPWYKALI